MRKEVQTESLELQTDGVSPRLAFFLERLADDPHFYLKADRVHGGLSTSGETYYSGILLEKLRDILNLVKNSPVIKAQAELFRKDVLDQMAGGTCSFSLSAQEREEFLGFLRQNHCELDNSLEKVIPSEMIV